MRLGAIIGGMLACIAVSGAAAQAEELSWSPRTLYLLRCSGCHQASGEGSIPAGVPPFPNLIGSFAGDPEGRVYITHVPGVVGSGLNNAEIAAVMNYIVEHWAGDGAGEIAPFTTEEVANLRELQIDDVVSYRRTLVERLSEEGLPVADYPWP